MFVANVATLALTHLYSAAIFLQDYLDARR